MEHQIICNSDEVRAFLEGRKTQTRRTRGLEDVNKNPGLWTFIKTDFLDWKTNKSAKGKFGAYFESELVEPKTISICPQICPYGVPGDILWVRETWCPVDDTEFGYEKWIDYKATPRYANPGVSHPAGWENCPDDEGALHWKSPVTMPRWASRLTLEVTNVRVERVQDINEAGAIKEGILRPNPYTLFSEIILFADLWDSINAKKGYGWDVNPWVWVIDLKRIDG